MRTRIEQIWQETLQDVTTRPIEADGFRLTRVDPTQRFDIYAGIDDAMHAILGIGVRNRPPALALESKAFDHFRRQRADGSWLLVLRLQRRGLEQVFGRMCQDLVDAARMVPTEDGLVSLFGERLRMWERLFLGADDALLKANEIRGLVAELVVLEHFLMSRLPDVAGVIGAWVGPNGADQDFRFKDMSTEVKSVAPGWRTVTISSLRQLDSQLPLHLVIVTLSSSAKGVHDALSLNSAVGRIESLIAEDHLALGDFKERLLSGGYVENPRYDEDWFIPSEMVSFAVSPSFPRLSAATVPVAIVGAKYELDLASCTEFRRESLPA